MDARDIVGILTPSTLLIFSATFMIIHRVIKKEIHSYNLSIGFFLLALGNAISWLAYESSPILSLSAPRAANLVALIFIARGLLLRAELSVPYKSLSIVALLGFISSFMAIGVYENLALYFTLGNIAAFIQTGIITYRLTQKERKNSMTTSLIGILGSVLVLLFAHSILSNLKPSEAVQLITFQNSFEWISLNIVIILNSLIGTMGYVLFTLTEAMGELQVEADTDELTGLARKCRFEKQAERTIAQTKRTPLPVSLIVCDIDKFKQVNDKFGHLAGDTILTKVSELIKSTSRTTDIVGRIGGEEFAILLWNADINGARLVAEQMRALLENHDYGDLIDGQSCTASFGVAQLEEGETYKDLFALADRALYRAKNTGRNRVNAATFILEEAA